MSSSVIALSERRPHRIAKRAVLVACATLSLATSGASAAVLLDNTTLGTATFAAQNHVFSGTVIKQGVEFSIDAGYTASLSSFTIGIARNSTSTIVPYVIVQLWSANGASLLVTQGFNATSTSAHYYECTLTDIGFANLAAGNYYLTISSSDLKWFNTGSSYPWVTPSAPTTGFNLVAGLRSTNDGTTWSQANSSYWQTASMYLQGTVNAAAVPGSGLAAIGSLGVAGFARRRRR